MMKLFLLTLLSTVTAVVTASNCCLCESCEDVAPTKIDALVQDEGNVVSCTDLAINIFESETDICNTVVHSHRETCCSATSVVPLLEKYDEATKTYQVIFPKDLAAHNVEDVAERPTTSIRRSLWTNWSPTPQQTTSWSTASFAWAIRWVPQYSSTTSTTASSSQCQLCPGGAFPTAPSQGVHIGHDTYTFTGSCRDLYTDIQSLPSTAQMCNPTRNALKLKCCQAAPSEATGMGTWSW